MHHISKPTISSVFAAALATALAVVPTAMTPTAAADEIPAEKAVTTVSSPGVDAINVRSGPGTTNPVIKTLAPNTPLTIGCWKTGEAMIGPYSDEGGDTIWYKVQGEDNSWIADAYTWTSSNDPVTRACEAPAPQQQPAPAEPPKEQPEPVDEQWIRNDGAVWWAPYGHYYGNTGNPVVIDWSLFANDSHFVKDMDQRIPIGGEGKYTSAPWHDGHDMYTSLGEFKVFRTSQNCFRIEDEYNFDNGIEDWAFYTKMKIDEGFGAAKPFKVSASGCLTPPKGA